MGFLEGVGLAPLAGDSPYDLAGLDWADEGWIPNL